MYYYQVLNTFALLNLFLIFFFVDKKWLYFQYDFTDDISIKAVRGSGPGGQNVNKGMAQVYSILIFLH